MTKEFIGKKSLDNLKFLINQKKIKKIVIFAGSKSYPESGAEEFILKNFEKKSYKVIFKQTNLPQLNDLKDFIRKIKIFKPEIIVAVGGGAVLDLAKITNCLYNSFDIKNQILKNKYIIKKKFCKLVAIPTTAGSGAEVTGNAVIYIDKKKYSIENILIKPDYCIIDPDLISTAPKKIAAAAGMDAIAQATESLLSLRSNNQSVEFAKISLKDSLKFFENHIKNKNFQTSYKMSIAALNAGKAINISKTTAPHALSYPFSSYYGIQHGHAVSLTLADFLKFNYEKIEYSKSSFDLKKRYQIIFNHFKVKNIADLVEKIQNISKNVGIELNFNKLKIKKKSQIDLVLKNINLQRLSNNPIDIDMQSIEKILRSKIGLDFS